MAETPYTVLSCCVSLDGFLDDATDRRLVLSDEADLDRVDAVRAGCDAILVGAGTIRADDPRLCVRSAERRAERVRRGLPDSPLKVTVTERGKLDPGARFFTAGSAARLVYAACASDVHESVGERATVVGLGPALSMRAVAEDLHTRGVRRLLVEGGARVLTQFLAEGVADELQLAVAPLLVGDPHAPRLLGPGGHVGDRARLAGVDQVGDVVVLRYAFTDRCVQRPEEG
ncbi:5-amino-6-(5-phosphoribosylamino)uracil reductase [Nocardioides terrae]|uniref:5-amino-6-(5-phosphoribosylamino)uracil reductase n=1 Tax=Nocardioides terrae TaxID=574651 RepID=A0A1I1JET2_9ACTN|nr:dihydrofolate reductase family protein [Nocardioides terrae]SFC44483.1 5-amino-6-(5-phosphoribosylamino)uracil reductase [Nocardioides terrae]